MSTTSAQSARASASRSELLGSLNLDHNVQTLGARWRWRAASRPRRRARSPRRPAPRPSVPTSGCRGSGPPSSGSRVPPAVTSTRRPASGPPPRASSASIAATISSGSAMRPRPLSPSASAPAAGPMKWTPRSRRRCALACVAGCSHMRTFIAGATSSGAGVESALCGHDVVGEAPRQLRERVGRARRDAHHGGVARRVEVRIGAVEHRAVVEHRPARQRSEQSAAR